MTFSTQLWHQEQEISDLVDYLFHHLSTDPGGSFQPGIYENLATHLAQRHGQYRTVAEIRSKFNSLKEIVTTIDHYNKIFGNRPDHDNILITPFDQEAWNLHLQSAQGQTLDILMTYCNNPFPHYRKLKILMDQVAGSEADSHQSPRLSTRMENDTAVDDGSSEIERTYVAALVGIMGAIMNHLISNIPSQPTYHHAKEATKFVIAERSLSEDERAILCIYYGKHMAEAAALSHMGDSLRNVVFRKVLEEIS